MGVCGHLAVELRNLLSFITNICTLCPSFGDVTWLLLRRLFCQQAASLGHRHANAPKEIEREHTLRLHRHHFIINWIAYAYLMRITGRPMSCIARPVHLAS